ncbi:MAG: TVP38/TMEM64 family protein [Phycisphaerae bacterium]|nr:TVP38/TMEM64 family protein [Phycisphaerae bacterium]
MPERTMRGFRIRFVLVSRVSEMSTSMSGEQTETAPRSESTEVCTGCGFALRGPERVSKCPKCGAVWPSRPRPKRLLATSVLAILWGTTPPLWGFVLLAYLGPISEWLRADPVIGVLTFATVFILAAGSGLLPTYSQAILGGWAFGFAWGFAASIVGFVGGAFVGWCIARLVAGHGIENWLDSKPKARIVREALVEQGFWKSLMVVTLLRLPPNSPFALSNLAMTASGVHIAPFLLGTAIGMMPRTAVACWMAAHGAAEAQDLQSLVEEKGWGMALIGLAILVVSFGIIGAIGKAALRRAMRSGRLPEEPARSSDHDGD